MANLLTCDALNEYPGESGRLDLLGLSATHAGAPVVVIELDARELDDLAGNAPLSLWAEWAGRKLLLKEWRGPQYGDGFHGVLWWRRRLPARIWRLSARIGDREVAERIIVAGG